MASEGLFKRLRRRLGLTHSPKDVKRLNANLAKRRRERQKAVEEARRAAHPKSKAA
jgi:hypothetical protein|tara:strand:+ start:292 stop:459 length:168 start_codon:yes stop_codon:yes gene_type:complete